MHKHKDFILSPVSNILNDGVAASAGIGSGIETYPVCDYIMQSVFLKMTGSQEQKMKCICWEMATNDYEYRYGFNPKSLGECSRYIDKQNIYSDLIKQIEKYDIPFSANLIGNKVDLLTTTISDITDIFNGTNLSLWAEYDFTKFKEIISNVSDADFADTRDNLFSHKPNKPLKEIYEITYTGIETG